MILTDIHDGRKKIYVRPSYRSVMRIAMVSGDGSPIPLSPTDVWSHGGSNGWSITLSFSAYINGFWLSFHREHRSALASGCAAFDLLVQVAPMDDLPQMTQC